MEDYLEEIARLITRDYSNEPIGNQTPKLKTTIEIYEQFLGIIPENQASPSDIFDILKKLQFKVTLRPLYEQAQKENGEVFMKKVAEIYTWVLYPRTQEA